MSIPAPQIIVSIVLYNNQVEDVRKTIDSLMATRLSFVLYLVINSPENEFEALIRSYDDDRIKTIHAPANPGFGAGHNLAIRQAEHVQYFLILNPDLSFSPGVLEVLYQYMEEHPDVGNIMPKVLNPDGSLQRLCKLLPTPLNVWSRRFFAHMRWAKRLNDRYELKDFDYANVLNIPNLSGCFMMIRSSVMRQIGGFDERFFLYLEDIDLNRRMGKISKTVFYPEVSVVHYHTRGSYKNRKLLRHHIISAIKYFNKWGWFFDHQRKTANKTTLEEIARLNRKP